MCVCGCVWVGGWGCIQVACEPALPLLTHSSLSTFNKLPLSSRNNCSISGLSFRIRGRRVPVLNLKEEVKALIFPVSGPVCVSEDEEKFKSVMTVFYQYELTVS